MTPNEDHDTGNRERCRIRSDGSIRRVGSLLNAHSAVLRLFPSVPEPGHVFVLVSRSRYAISGDTCSVEAMIDGEVALFGREVGSCWLRS